MALAKNTKLLIGLSVAIIIIALVAVLAIYVSNVFHSLSKLPVPKAEGPMHLSAYINTTGLAFYNNTHGIAGYAIVSYHTSNALYANFLLNTYPTNPMPPIYFVNSTDECYDCVNQYSLYSQLKSYLEYYALLPNASSMQYVPLQNISSIPPGSMVIIASGLMPELLMQNANGTMPIERMLSNADTIIYIGKNFSRLSGLNGIIYVTPPQTLDQLYLDKLGYSPFFTKKMTNPLNLSFITPTFQFLNGSNFGPLSFVYSLNGTVIAFSNTPTSWSNESSLASDIAKAVNSHFWMYNIAYGSANVTSIGNGTIGVFTTGRPFINSPEAPTLINSTYSVLSITLYNSTGRYYENLPFRLHYLQNGTLSMPAVVGLSAQVPMVISMSTSSAVKHLVIPHLDVLTGNMSYIMTLPVGFFNTTSNINVVKYASFDLPSGYYLVFLRDFYNRYYSSALFSMATTNVTPVALDFQNGTFIFKLTSNGMPVTNASYSISLNGAYAENGTVTNGIAIYKLPKGAIVNYGSQLFDMRISQTSLTYSTSYVKKILHIPAFYIEFAIVAIVVIALNVVLKAPNRDEYYIDVPDFPPVKKASFTVDRKEVLSVFDKIDAFHRWRDMPLTADEVKSGIDTNIKYNNMPVAITLQNVNSILNKLIATGDVIQASDYYAPKKFVDESKHDIEYLAIFRKLRDYCIAHAMLFTDLDSSDVADMVITKGGVQAYIIIYSRTSGMREIKLVSGIKVFIVFIDDEAELEFTEKLYASYGDQAEALKVGIRYGYIKLVDSDNLDQILF